MTTAALIISIVALALVLYLIVLVNGVRKTVATVPAEGGVYEAFRQLDDALRVAEDQIDDLGPRLAAVEASLPRAIKHTGIVAYDAFDDIAGNLSRSVAILNDRGDGFVISLLVGRSETRFFTKQVDGRSGLEPLSPEEDAAIARAMAG